MIAAAVYRAMNAIPPEADSLGGIGVVALVVNVAAALALMRFRKTGDALANIAVIIPAVLVAWLQNAKPDLIVAAIIALLFLHSARDIIRDAGSELRKSSA